MPHAPCLLEGPRLCSCPCPCPSPCPHPHSHPHHSPLTPTLHPEQVRLQRLSTAFLNEAGSVLQTLMDAASKQFAIELLLPWVQRIALLEPGKLT